MKKLLPLLILTLFLASVCTGAVVQDSVKHTLISDSGTRYEGVITEGTKEKGSGVFIVQSGERKGNRYEGEFVGEKKHGWGIETFVFGAQFVGEFRDGNWNGQGTYTIYDGSFKYVGELKDGVYHGQGTMIFLDGAKYVGELKDGLPNGQGTHTSPNGSEFAGEWKDDKPHGLGTRTFSNGSQYVGEWKNGQYNGKGVLFKVNGEIKSGTWLNNELHNSWTIEVVSNFLKNKYPQFTGFDYVAPTPVVTPDPIPVVTAVKSSGISISGLIAVIDFEGNDISPSEARALTDRLRGELVGSSRFTIVERGKMEEILKEQAFQQTGCVSSECAVEVGKLLSVENIIIGSISRVGSINSVTAKVVSVESGEIIRSTVYDHSGDIGGLLTQGMRKVAEELGK